MWNHAESCPVIPWWKDQMSEAHIFFSTFRCHGAGFHFVLLEMHQAAVSERCTNFVLAHSGRGSRSVAGNSNLSAQDYYILYQTQLAHNGGRIAIELKSASWCTALSAPRMHTEKVPKGFARRLSLGSVRALALDDAQNAAFFRPAKPVFPNVIDNVAHAH
jgi:hypothetical protein